MCNDATHAHVRNGKTAGKTCTAVCRAAGATMACESTHLLVAPSAGVGLVTVDSDCQAPYRNTSNLDAASSDAAGTATVPNGVARRECTCRRAPG